MQAPSADETIQRLIFGLSELDELGETIISGHGNFSVSSRTYLRMILGTLQVTGGAILLFHPTENTLTIKSSVNVRDESLVIRVPPGQIPGFLDHPFIDLAEPPAVLRQFLEQIHPLLKSLDARFWFPLKIRDEFLGVISIGAFFNADAMEDWNRELLNVFANHTSIAIAYSQLQIRSRAERFRLFMLSDTATQICKSLDTEAVQEEVVAHVVTLLDANAAGLMQINPSTKRLEMKSLFSLESHANDELRRLSIPLDTEENLHPALSMIAEVATQADKTLVYNDEKNAALFGRKNLIAVPMRGREEILGVLVVADKVGRSGATLDFTDGDKTLLEAFANQAGVAIENAFLYQEALEARRLQAEMEEAEKIQQTLIPDTLPDIPGYEATGRYQPRGGVGGDYYDCIPESDGTWGLAIADVSGKGMQAALLMATLRAGLRSEATRKTDLPTMALTLNSLLNASGDFGKYATFFFAQLHAETNQLISINAGHNDPMVIRSDGRCEWLKKGGVMLGIFPDDMIAKMPPFEQETTHLASGDIVLFYTDGVTETTNINDELYGEARLQDIAVRLRNESAETICRAIYDEVIEFQGEAEQFDDLTLMVLKKQ
ncbi:MAG: SpoIIE family protein phosphatase [Candidatus Poribacteria bacterium]|nr:SpoIIE family protein phosphatase [Candidatus Poribacteria bacterium]MDE0504034.1 SpoIIE family protein phosphatase [Candidatus Poribacteria bacterium]